MPRPDKQRPIEDHITLVAVGAAIRARRDALRLSGPDVKKRSGVDPSYLAEVENGKREPGLLWLVKVASALDWTVWELLASSWGLRESVKEQVEPDPSDATT